MKWQPIETAPKDGKSILILIKSSYEEDANVAIQAKWDSDLDKWNPITLDSHGCGCCGSQDPEPTHWIPLPEL